MGTRSLTNITIGDEPVVCIYRQYDGHIESHGHDLLEVLSLRLTNGIGADSEGTANGPDCLAAQIVSRLKGDQVGGVYLYPIGSADEEFTYDITLPTIDHINDPIRVAVSGGASFKGTLDEFRTFVAKHRGES